MSQLPSYKYHLNGEDRHLPDLPLKSLRAKGGTMALWDASLDPFITILPSASSSVLPLILNISGFNISAHIGIYLPKRGLEQEWTIAMGFLSMVVEDTLSSHPVIPIYIRGDANTNPNHPTRLHILQEFMERYGLYSFPLGHTTYHHFTGNGSRDSQLDVLISSLGHPDKLVDIKCKKDNPLVTSSHDVIISSFKLFSRIHRPDPTPKVSRPWYRVLWDNDGILSYSSILDKTLPSILTSCGDAPSPETFLSILEQTNQAILDAANLSFKVKSLSQPHKPSKPRVDPVVKKLSIQISQLSVQIKRTTDSEIRQGLL